MSTTVFVATVLGRDRRPVRQPTVHYTLAGAKAAAAADHAHRIELNLARWSGYSWGWWLSDDDGPVATVKRMLIRP